MSLRSRLLLGVTAVAIVLIGAAVVVINTTEAYLMGQVDEQLASVAGRIPDAPPGFPPDGAFDGSPQQPSAGLPTPTDEPQQLSPLYLGFLTDAGEIETIFAPNLIDENAALPVLTRSQVVDAAESGEPFVTGSTDGTRYRVQATGNEALGGIEIVALALDDTDAAIARLVAVETAATLVALGVLGLVAWWVMRLGVRPIKRMADTAAQIAGGDLSSRVPEGDPRTEAGELGTALNQMLGRIEEAFDERSRTEERLRRFVADASHELRTPVTTIQGYADLYRRGGLQDPEELDDAMRRTRQEAARMGALVEDMLQLARLDQGRALRMEPVDLTSLAQDAVADAHATDPDRPITADTEGPVVVNGDIDRLRQVLANLVGNALLHSPPGIPVRVRTRRTGDQAVLEVSDDGPGMSEETAEHAFERFFRGDPSRSRSRGGAGLGLAIVHAIVTAHNGQIELRSAPGKGTTALIHLPTIDAAGDQQNRSAPASWTSVTS